MASLPSYRLPGDGRYPLQYFVAEERFEPDRHPMPIGMDTDDKIRSAVASLWEKTYQARRPEHERMNLNELYYSGKHYEDARDNFDKEITNYPFSVVETVWPEMVEAKPRPEIQPGFGLNERDADDLNQFATWLMNTNGFDRTHRVGTREMLKLGWNVDLVVFDRGTGMPYPKPYCNWDYYPDMTASGDDSMMYYFLAGPVSTPYLQNLFPEHRDRIRPDGWVSPSYEVLVQPYIDQMGIGGGGGGERRIAPYAYREGETQPLGTTSLTQPGGTRGDASHTTFLVQLFFRDLTYMQTAYAGKRWGRDTSGSWTWHWDTLRVPELVCDGGWRVIQMTSHGVILDVAPLDRCFAGRNVVVGRDYEQGFRMDCPGEIDHLIPKVRGINRRVALLNAALEFQATPVAVFDKQTGISPDKKSVLPGEVLRKNQGTKIEWLESRGPVEQQFAMLQGERQDIDVISGIHDVLQGQRPPGIEAGVAIQRLQQQGKVRIRGKETGQFLRYAALLKKLMVGAAMKLNRRIMFTATDGRIITLEPDTLLAEYQIQFVQGSGLMSSRAEKRQEAFELYDRKAIDEEELLTVLDWKNRHKVLARMEIRRQQEMMMAFAQAQSAGQEVAA